MQFLLGKGLSRVLIVVCLVICRGACLASDTPSTRYQPWSYVWLTVRLCTVTAGQPDQDYPWLSPDGSFSWPAGPAGWEGRHFRGAFSSGEAEALLNHLKQIQAGQIRELAPHLLLGTAKEMTVPLPEMGEGTSMKIAATLVPDRYAIVLNIGNPHAAGAKPDPEGSSDHRIWNGQTAVVDWTKPGDKQSRTHLICLIEAHTIDPYDEEPPAPDPQGTLEDAALKIRTSLLQSRLPEIMLPKYEIRGAGLEEAMDLWLAQCRVATGHRKDLWGEGIQFALRAGTVSNSSRNSMELTEVSAVDALRYVTESASVRYRLEGNQVLLFPIGEGGRELATRTYTISQDFLHELASQDKIPEGAPDDPFALSSSPKLPADPSKRSASQILSLHGITFPEGAFAHYDSSRGQLEVRTLDYELGMIDDWIEKLRTRPPEKMRPPAQQWVIPQINFHTATLRDALDSLSLSAKSLDPVKQGLQVRCDAGCQTGRRFDLSASGVPVLEAFIYAAELTGHEIHVVKEGLLVKPKAGKR